MDLNKLQKLKDINYRIHRCCASCKHSIIAPGQEFGTCDIHTYQHLKHIGAPRHLSIHSTGVCDYHQWNGTMEHLEGFAQFIK